ncbi:hypothetical protein POSPLADRAFT_1182874 [Postia placenta MAD-698-R-SB12]|uniref:Uncharacterized protein n=1 Tax=Postia placenta MAD-698-R-SB12 TaxID=670580 RepID=A0A1X6MVF2_9APHY|nr:hypothetical protein POSPLADRAFT_1182874 [Postia placenta MAD-698-R-SB12]OSX60357.1 hypothetical protein POSPLADRAFT_1182874 [Postia placenta MAD-698-R-SB12]
MDRAVCRSLIREVNRASILSREARPKTTATNFRVIFEQGHRSGSNRFDYDLQNALTFMRSQRMHKTLLDRYNPLHDLTTEERIKATARRVGLDMPIHTPEGEDGS